MCHDTMSAYMTGWCVYLCLRLTYACALINILCYATKGKYLHMLIIFLSPFLHEGINGVTKLCQNAQSFCYYYSFMTWITWPKRSYYSLKFVKYISTSTLLCNICILWLGQKMQFPTRKKLYNQVCDKDNWRGIKIENICKYILKEKECEFWGGVNFVLHFSFIWVNLKLSSKNFSFFKFDREKWIFS